MPEPKRWVQFLSYAGIMVASGVIFTKYFVPSDEKFLNELSPELKRQYEAEKAIRERAQTITKQRAEQTADDPAWLRSAEAMRRFDKQIMEQARREIDAERRAFLEAEERARLKELAKLEKKKGQ